MFIYVVRRKIEIYCVWFCCATQRRRTFIWIEREHRRRVSNTFPSHPIEMETIKQIRNYLLAIALQIGSTIQFLAFPMVWSTQNRTQSTTKKWRGWAGVGFNLYTPHALSTNDKKKKRNKFTVNAIEIMCGSEIVELFYEKWNSDSLSRSDEMERMVRRWEYMASRIE